MQRMILNKHAKFYRDWTVGGTKTVINLKNHHIFRVNYFDLPKMLFEIFDLQVTGLLNNT